MSWEAWGTPDSPEPRNDIDVEIMMREEDRQRFPDPVFNSWLDENKDGATVWHHTKCIESAWIGWQQAWQIYGALG